MEMAGHKCVGHCEIDKYADMSYRMMHTVTEEQRKYLLSLPTKDMQNEIRKDEYLNGEWYASDITRVEPGELPEAEVYCFGFPCQSFSIAGLRGGFEDTRGTLFFEVMRLAKERHPEILFAENVKGLLSHDGGATFGTIIRTMDEFGYHVQWQVLNSKHFNVPQNRERLYIVGCTRKGRIREVFPLGQDNEEIDVLRSVDRGAIVVRDMKDNEVKQIGNIVDDSEIGFKNPQRGRVYSQDGISPTLNTCSGGGLESKVLVRPCLTPDREKKRQNGRRFKEDGEESFTLTSQDRHGVLIDDGEKPLLRKLTPKEFFRLQGFPDELFDRAARINSDSQLYKQGGNAVTVNVIYEIVKRL